MRSIVHAQVRDDKVFVMYPPCWVKVGDVTERTGWDFKKLRRMREQGNIKFERRTDGMWYDLASIHPFFLKQHA